MAKSCVMCPTVIIKNPDGSEREQLSESWSQIKNALKIAGITSPMQLHEMTKRIWISADIYRRKKGIISRELTLGQISKIRNVMEFVCKERGITAEEYLKNVEENHLSKLFDKYKKENAKRLSKGETLSNLSLGIAEDIAELYNQEYINIVPGVIATVERQIDGDKTTYAVKLKDAYHADSHNGEYLESIDGIDQEAKRSAKIAASKSLKEKIESACKVFGIEIQQVITSENSNWQLVKNEAGKIVSIIQYVNGNSDVDIVETLTEEFAHALIAGMSNNKAVIDLLDILREDPELVRTILNISSHSTGDNYEAYATTYSQYDEQLIQEAAGKLLKAQILQNFGLLDNLRVSNVLATINNLLIDSSNTKENVTALETAYNSGIEAATNEAVNSLKTSLPVTDAQLSSLADIATSLLELSNKDTSQFKNEIYQGNETFWEKYVGDSSEDQFRLYDLAQKQDATADVLNKLNSIEWQRIQNMRNLEYNNQQDINLENFNANFVVDRHFSEKMDAYQQISQYIDSGIVELNKITDAMNLAFSKDSVLTLTEKAAVLRKVRVMCEAYRDGTDLIVEKANQLSYDTNQATADIWKKVKNDLETNLKKLQESASKLNIVVEETILDILSERIQPYIDKIGTNPFSNEGVTLDAKDILRQASHDITFSERWLDAMSQTNDVLCRVLDEIAKEAYEKAHNQSVEDEAQIKNMGLKYGMTSQEDTEWLYEKKEVMVKGEDGKWVATGRWEYSGYYIAKYNYRKWEKELKGFKYKLYKQGKHKGSDEYEQEILLWHDGHSQKNEEGEFIPNDNYINVEFEQYMADPQKKAFYEAFMEKKKEIESRLPEQHRNLYRTVMIRQSSIEVFNGLKDEKGFLKAAYEAWKNELASQLLVKEDDTIFGDLTDKEAARLPIFYVKKLPKGSIHKLSRDPISSLIAYASMANNYQAMNDHIDIMELAQEQAHKRVVGDKEDGGLVAKRIDDFMNQVVYGKSVKNDHTIKIGENTISTEKAANGLCRVAFMDKLAFNILGGITNYITGEVSELIESVGSRYFNHKDLAWAHKEIWSNMGKLLDDRNKNVPTQKASIWIKHFNVLQSADYDFRNEEFQTKQGQKRALSVPALFFSSGEYMLAAQTALAIAHKIHVWDNVNEKEVTLYEAYDPVAVTEGHEEYEATLQPNSKYSIMEYDETNNVWIKTNKPIDTDFLNAYKRKVAGINRKMHGIYNSEDLSPVNQYALGRLALLFHKYIKSGINYRFGKANFDFNEGEWTEGYMRTAGKFILNCIKDVRHGETNIMAHWDNLSNEQQSNIKKALAEYAIFASLLGGLALMISGGWGKDKTCYLKRLAMLLTSRQSESMAMFVPSHKMPEAFINANKPAVIGVCKDIIGTLGMFIPSNYTEYETSGFYKGYSKAMGSFLRSPFGAFFAMPIKASQPEVYINMALSTDRR